MFIDKLYVLLFKIFINKPYNNPSKSELGLFGTMFKLGILMITLIHLNQI